MKRLLVWCLAAALLGPHPASAARKPVEIPPLTQEHIHSSGAFAFKTPDGWKVETAPSDPGGLQVSGDGVIVRFRFWPREVGYDGLHGDCMTDRIGGLTDTDQVQFEYDYVSGPVANRRFLDSAFSMTYDGKVLGHRRWRQRNLTIVGGGQALCVITYAPADLWRKKATRGLLDAVVASLTFR